MQRPGAPTAPLVSIRPMRSSDLPAVIRIAQRDGLPVPPGELLVAEAGGDIRAALSRLTGEGVADPFHPSEHLVELLRLRADQLRAERGPANGTAVPERPRGWRPGWGLPVLRWARR